MRLPSPVWVSITQYVKDLERRKSGKRRNPPFFPASLLELRHLICPWTGTYGIGLPWSSSDLDRISPSASLGSPACKQQILGLLSLHNLKSQFLIINLHVFMSPLGSGSVLFLLGKASRQGPHPESPQAGLLSEPEANPGVSRPQPQPLPLGAQWLLPPPDQKSTSGLPTHPTALELHRGIHPRSRSQTLPAPEPKKALAYFNWLSVFTFFKIPSRHVNIRFLIKIQISGFL